MSMSHGWLAVLSHGCLPDWSHIDACWLAAVGWWSLVSSALAVAGGTAVVGEGTAVVGAWM